MPQSRIHSVCIVVLAGLLITKAWSQGPGSDATHKTATLAKPEVGLVTSVRVVHERGVPAIEIVSTHPVVPTIQPLDSPPRLVIDLSNARSGLQQNRIPVLQENILTVRAQQLQKDPPVLRLVLDLLIPYGYTWDSAGNRLMVRLKPPEDPNVGKKTAIESPQVLSTKPAEVPAVVPVSSGVGDVLLAGSRFAAGSSLTAGSETAILRLAKGGEVRVCPGTTLSLTPSRNAKDLMLGMGTGALEMHYAPGASADTVLTPDFRILFAGPGEFHYAVSTDSHGNTCVRGLRGNTAPVTVSELIGDRTYQVQATEQAVFHTGRIDKMDSQVPVECGCPPPVRVMRTNATPARIIPDSQAPANLTLAQKSDPGAIAPKPENDSQTSEPAQTLSSGPEIQPLPPSQPNDVHVTVDVPFVFQGKNRSATPPAPTEEAARLPVMESSARPVSLDAQLLAPAEQRGEVKPGQRGVLRRIKGFFAAMFR